jgi:hypothetical protein
MEFTADQVWGLAVAADRINSGYFKEDVVVYEGGCRKVIKQANKMMVKQWLRDGMFTEATEEDIQKGQECRAYFNTFTLKALTGKINDFEKQALKIAQMDQFTGRNLLEFAIVSCLPEIARRDRVRTEIKREIYHSEQLQGAEGDTITGEIEVINSRFNPDYNKWKITARLGEAFVDFWFTREAQPGNRARIKGKIKRLREDKTTQLNYVKLL